jgi:hypothetical protein
MWKDTSIIRQLKRNNASLVLWEIWKYGVPGTTQIWQDIQKQKYECGQHFMIES